MAGGGDNIALVDPLAADPKLLTKLFESDAVAVLHAAQQDLDVLTHAVGAVPRHIYDTQIAAGFIGYATPSLVVLVQGELGETPAKGDRLTDWLRRPLTTTQMEYAAADVALPARTPGPPRLPSSPQLGRSAWAARGVRGAAYAADRPDRSPTTRGPG